MRCFFALDLPEAMKAEIGAWQMRQERGLRWARPEGLHLTLAFLGEQNEAGVEAAREAGAAVAATQNALILRTSVLAGFPRSEAARILWLGLAPDPELEALAGALRRAMKTHGIPFDPRPFIAHLTLARVERPIRVADLGATPPPLSWRADALFLMRSEGNGTYACLGVWPLR